MLESLTLDQLRVLVAIVDEGSFGGAARSLGRAQGSVSYHVATLERLLDLKLFDREGRRRPTVTAAGQALVAEARGVLARMARMHDTASAIAAGLELGLALSVDSLLPARVLASVLTALRATYPTVHVQVRTGILGRVTDDVREGHADVGIAGAEIPEALSRRPAFEVELVPVIAPSHPLASLGRPAEDHELAQHVHIVLSADRGASSGPQARDFESPHPWRVDDLHTRRELLRAGLGWSRMPRESVAADLETGTLVPLSVARWPSHQRVQLYAVHRRDVPLGPAGRWLVERLAGPGQE